MISELWGKSKNKNKVAIKTARSNLKFLYSLASCHITLSSLGAELLRSDFIKIALNLGLFKLLFHLHFNYIVKWLGRDLLLKVGQLLELNY